jgi:hypothetical protein
MMLFGKDMEEFVSLKLEYRMQDDSVQELTFAGYFFKLIEDFVASFSNPIDSFLPFMEYYNLVNPHKRNNINKERYIECIKELMDQTKDGNSIY